MITRETVEKVFFGLVVGAIIGAIVTLIPLRAVGLFIPVEAGGIIGGALGVAWGLAPDPPKNGPNR